MLLIRPAQKADFDAVAAIYAHHVLFGLATFEEVPPSAEEMWSRRQAVIEAEQPYLVADFDGQVVGYSYVTGHRSRSAYRFAIEDSVYVAHGLRGQGIGSALLAALIERCEAGPWRQMLAVIGDSGNAASISLHRRHGFEVVGTFRSVGFKLGRWVDTVLMQRGLGTGDASVPMPSDET